MGTVTMVGRLLISLAVVLGIMWLIARRLNGRRGRLRGRSGRLIEVLGRQQLSRSASVAVVQVLDQALIIGVTDGQVSVLGETDLAGAKRLLTETAPAAPAARTRTARPSPQRTDKNGSLTGSALSPATWRQTVDALRELTVRSR